MSPRKAILEHDESQQPRIASRRYRYDFLRQRDISVPQAKPNLSNVIVEGEVIASGVYKLETNETLRSVLQRAGGLSPNSYVYGNAVDAGIGHEIKEQKSLDELVRTMDVQIRQSAISIAASSQSGELPQLLAPQQATRAVAHSSRHWTTSLFRSSPRHDLTAFPDIAMEDNDR